jgi:hypothetical protein
MGPLLHPEVSWTDPGPQALLLLLLLLLLFLLLALQFQGMVLMKPLLRAAVLFCGWCCCCCCCSGHKRCCLNKMLPCVSNTQQALQGYTMLCRQTYPASL